MRADPLESDQHNWMLSSWAFPLPFKCVCVIGSGAALPLRLRWFQRTFPRWDESYQKECNHSINGRESATVKSTGMSITSWFFQRNHTTTWKSSPQQTPSWRWLKKKIHPATTPCKVVVLFLFLSSARNHRFTIRIYSPEAPRGSFSLSLFILTFSTHTGGKKKKIIVSRTARSCVSMCVWRCVFPQQTGHSLHTHSARTNALLYTPLKLRKIRIR